MDIWVWILVLANIVVLFLRYSSIDLRVSILSRFLLVVLLYFLFFSAPFTFIFIKVFICSFLFLLERANGRGL